MFESDHEPTADELEQHLIDSVALISRVTASMLGAIRALDVAQIHAWDGCRGPDEWLASRLDIEAASARTLLTLARAHDRQLGTSWGTGRSRWTGRQQSRV